MNNQRPKKRNITTPSIIGGGLVTLLSLLVSQPVSAIGPVFDAFPIGYNGAQNTDYPLLDARNVTAGGSLSTSQTDHDDGVTVSAGDTIEFVVYYHNGAADAPENTASNVRVRVNLPTSTSNAHTVSGSISADNAATVASAGRGGNAVIKVNGAAQTLEYITGSTLWYPNKSTTGQSVGDGVISSSGLLLGDIRGCWDFAGYVKFRVRVGTAAAASLEIDKTVALASSSSYSNIVEAQPSDIVKFRIVTIARNADVSQTIIRDLLPASFIYRTGTTKVNGITVSDSSGLFGSGYEFGLLQKDQNVEITFEAQVASASYFTSLPQTITNTANARGQNVSTVQDTAEVRVLGQVAGTSFELSKSAFNQTQGINAQSALASAGDIINYKLTYSNTGGAALSNIVVEDDLSDVLKLAEVINFGEGSLTGSVIRFPAITVPAGVAIDKTFQVRVRDVSASETDLVMTNIYGNRVDIQVRPPTVKGIFKAPPTGPKENVVALLAVLVTAAMYLYQKYPLLKRRWSQGKS